MATRYNKSEATPGTLSSGYEGEATPDLSLPSCGIEDVDRAFYELFNVTLPLHYRITKESSEQRRIPVVFATGERFAVASKKEPLRDRNGALILPLISISRSGVEQESTKPGGVSDKFNEMVVRKRVSPEDPLYQSLVNSKGFNNAKFNPVGPPKDFSLSTGRLLDPRLGSNIYEVFVIPMPRYFTLKYEVTVWGQYTQQVNDVITAIIGAYPQPGNRTIRIDTKKGYWFVAYFEPSISQETNFSDFSESERITKATLTAEVPGYLILPEFPGSPTGMRSFVSAPEISFTTDDTAPPNPTGPSIPSGDESAYILSDIETEDSPLYPGMVGVSGVGVSEAKTGVEREGVFTATPGKPGQYPGAPGLSSQASSPGATIGKTSRVKSRDRLVSLTVNPYTGKEENIVARVVDGVASKGEEVLVIDVLETLRRR